MPFFTSSGAASLPESNAKHCCIDSPGEDNDYDYDYKIISSVKIMIMKIMIIDTKIILRTTGQLTSLFEAGIQVAFVL